ncbi:MAG: biopolymer transporter ExbD [bacterium]
MAFRKLKQENRRLTLLSLIDLIFILLIFFVITSVMVRMTTGETNLYIPTPKNEPGEAQVLIQIIDEDSYLWLDHTAIDTLRQYEHRLRDPEDDAEKMRLLLQKMTLDQKGLESRLKTMLNIRSRSKSKEYFVLIRCPDNSPYFLVTNILEKFMDNPYFEYGCVSGALEDLLNSRNIYIKDNILQIDF